MGRITTPVETCDAETYQSDAGESHWPRDWRAYANLFACWLLMANSWGVVNSYGTFASYYSQHLFKGRDILELSLIGGTDSFFILLLSTPVGRLLDAGHSCTLASTGTVLVFLGHFPLAFINVNSADGYGDYALTWLFQGLIAGLGMSCFFVTSSQVAAIWFPNCRPIAIGIVSTGASVFGLVYPMMIKFLLADQSYKTAVWAYAVLIGGTSFIACLVLLMKNPKHNYRTDINWKDLKVWIDVEAFGDPAFCWLTVGVCWMFFGFYAVFFNLEDWAAYNGFAKKDTPPGLELSLHHEVHDDAIRTFWLLCVANGSSSFGRIASCLLAQKHGPLTIHFIATIIGSMILIGLWIPTHTLATCLAFVILYGIVSGAVVGLPPASMSNVLSKRKGGAQNLGQWTGMMYSIAAPFAVAGPVIAGHLVSHYNTYLAVQIWSGVCIAFAAVCFFIAWFYVHYEKTPPGLRRMSSAILRLTKTQTNEKAGSSDDVEKV